MDLSRSARSWRSSPATVDCLDARQETQLTVGVLLLKSATCFSFRGGHTFSMTSHNMRISAISRSELVMVPDGFSLVWRDALISFSHWYKKNMGGHDEFSPNTTSPTPWPDTSYTPVKSRHAGTSSQHWVGVRVDSLRRV